MTFIQSVAVKSVFLKFCVTFKMYIEFIERLEKLSISDPRANNFSQCKSEIQKDCANFYNILPMKFFQPDEDGDTGLHIAIAKGYHQAAISLIKMAPTLDFLNTADDMGQCALHLAVIMKNSKLVRFLIIAGARSDIRNRNGESPLHIAVRNGDLDCCTSILEPIKIDEMNELGRACSLPRSKPDLDQWNYDGKTCVHIATERCDVETLKYLAANGANVNAREGLSGCTALHLAVVNDDETIVNFLLEECDNLDFTAETYAGKNVTELECKVSKTIAQKLQKVQSSGAK